MRRALLLLPVLLLAACGGSGKSASTTTTAPTVPTPGPGSILYANAPWAVVLDGDKATALQLQNNTWVPDTSGKVKITVLGPKATSSPQPQVAVELSAKAPLVESALWVDGVELLEKGGGLKPTRGTIYGTTVAPLGKGKHVAVAYGRTTDHATAVAWTFRVA
jgi:hypothetical protein